MVYGARSSQHRASLAENCVITWAKWKEGPRGLGWPGILLWLTVGTARQLIIHEASMGTWKVCVCPCFGQMRAWESYSSKMVLSSKLFCGIQKMERFFLMCLCACMCWCMLRPAESLSYLGARVPGSCKPSDVSVWTWTLVLQEQQEFLTAELFLQRWGYWPYF